MLLVNNLRLVLDNYPLEYNLAINEGEIVALQGPSGVGKTTLLNLIAGFLTAQEGSIHWRSQRIDTLTADLRPVSMLFQDHNLFEHISVWENLCLGFLNIPPSHQLKQAAQKLGIEQQLNKFPAELSGGQRQRAALIRTLLREEPIILLDEPFAELDPETRKAAGQWTKETAKATGKTLLLVTHQEEDSKQVADRAITFSYPNTDI